METPATRSDLNLLTENLDFQEVIRGRSAHLLRNCLQSKNETNANRGRKRCTPASTCCALCTAYCSVLFKNSTVCIIQR